MKSPLIKLQALLITIYITSVIVFKMNYIIITHILGIFMILNLILLMFVESGKKYRYNNVVLMYFIFALYALMSSIWSIEFDISSYRGIQLLVQALYLFVLYNSFKIFKLQNTFLNAILLGSLVNYLFLLNIIPAPFQVVSEYGNRAFGTVGNSNVLAIIMILSILTSIVYIDMKDRIGKLFYYYQYLNILLALYIILLTASKKGTIFGLLLLLFFLIQMIRNPKIFFKFIFWNMLGIVILSYFIDLGVLMSAFENTLHRFFSFESQLSSGTRQGSTGERKYFIELGLVLFQNNPILGYGLDTFKMLNYTGLYSHNNYIELAVGLGVLGLILYYSIHFIMIRIIYAMRNKKLRNLFLFFIFILLSMDVALVSYGFKIVLMTFVFLSVYAEQNHKVSFS